MYVLGYAQMDSIHLDNLLHLFLLANDSHSLQLATRDVYEVEVHNLIYGHTRS
jgi:hypothetical protein